MRLILLCVLIGLSACSNGGDGDGNGNGGLNQQSGGNNVQPAPQSRSALFVAATMQTAANGSDTSEPVNVDAFGGSTFQEDITDDRTEPEPVL